MFAACEKMSFGKEPDLKVVIDTLQNVADALHEKMPSHSSMFDEIIDLASGALLSNSQARQHLRVLFLSLEELAWMSIPSDARQAFDGFKSAIARRTQESAFFLWLSVCWTARRC